MIIVKAAGEHKIYSFNPALTSGSFDVSTIDMINNGGNQPDISHVSVYGTPYTAPKKAALSITKILDGSKEVSADKTFDFTVTGQGVNESFQLAGGESKRIEGLDAGTYTITEANAEVTGFDHELKFSGKGVDGTNGSFIVTIGENDLGSTVYVTATNTYTSTEGDKGLLSIEKKFEGLDEEQYEDLEITVKAIGENETFTFILNESNDWSLEKEIPVGEYTIEELLDSAAVDGHSFDVSYSPEGKVEVKTGSENKATVTVTNTYEEELKANGWLAISKVFAGGVTEAQYDNLAIKVTATSEDHTETFELNKANNWTEIRKVPIGEYKIVEDTSTAAIGGYSLSVSYSPSDTATVDEGPSEMPEANEDGSYADVAEVTSVEVTNTYTTGWNPPPPPSSEPPEEEIEIIDPSDPLAEFPPEEEIEIIDPQSPLADTPQTSDGSNMLLLVAIMISCAFGLVVINLPRKKKEQ